MPTEIWSRIRLGSVWTSSMLGSNCNFKKHFERSLLAWAEGRGGQASSFLVKCQSITESDLIGSPTELAHIFPPPFPKTRWDDLLKKSHTNQKRQQCASCVQSTLINHRRSLVRLSDMSANKQNHGWKTEAPQQPVVWKTMTTGDATSPETARSARIEP